MEGHGSNVLSEYSILALHTTLWPDRDQGIWISWWHIMRSWTRRMRRISWRGWRRRWRRRLECKYHTRTIKDFRKESALQVTLFIFKVAVPLIREIAGGFIVSAWSTLKNAKLTCSNFVASLVLQAQYLDDNHYCELEDFILPNHFSDAVKCKKASRHP